uniref:Uncharacterized protein n=1 Tax=Anguilla anguilla TaxID=7936 RepID=A0A0E9QAW5_ANGAN
MLCSCVIARRTSLISRHCNFTSILSPCGYVIIHRLKAGFQETHETTHAVYFFCG